MLRGNITPISPIETLVIAETGQVKLAQIPLSGNDLPGLSPPLLRPIMDLSQIPAPQGNLAVSFDSRPD
jgi:hypothetical protein